MITDMFSRVRHEHGVTYLMLMFAVVLIGITTTAAAKQWKAMVQRELEADLLVRGIEIQNALALYSATMKAGRVTPGEVYPPSLAELTRLPKPFLRKAYLDPIMRGEWEYLRGPGGGIMGVRSKSVAEPFKKHEFPQAVRHFDGRKSYHDWVFQHPNPSTASALPMAVMPGQNGPNQAGIGSNLPGAAPQSIPAPPSPSGMNSGGSVPQQDGSMQPVQPAPQ
jgi:type II secretory pathway pseudopilin PulG